MHRVGAVGKAQRARMDPGAGQRRVLADPRGPVHLHRFVDNHQRHLGGHNLDLADPGGRRARVALIHHPRRLQAQKPRLFDAHPAIGNDIEIGPQLRQRLAECLARAGALAEHLQSHFRLTDGAHGVVNAPRPQPPLRDLKTPAFAQQQVFARNPDRREPHMHMPVRRVVVAVDLHGAQHLDALGIGRHHDHRMTLVLGQGVVAGAHHDDIDRTARIASTAGPPFLAVQNIIIAIAHAGHGKAGRVGRGHIWLGHHIGRPNFAGQKRRQPAVLHGACAVAFEYFHVAGVGRVAVKDLGCQKALAHFFGEIGVFDGAQTQALVAVGQPEIPQARRFGLGFQAFQYFGLARRELPTVALAHLDQKFVVHGPDAVADHRRHFVQQHLFVRAETEIHILPPCKGRARRRQFPLYTALATETVWRAWCQRGRRWKPLHRQGDYRGRGAIQYRYRQPVGLSGTQHSRVRDPARHGKVWRRSVEPDLPPDLR